MRWLCLALLPAPLWADALATNRIIRAGEIVTAADLSLVSGQNTQGLSSMEAVAGQEARVILYPGKPIQSGHLSAPTLVQRNQIVPLSYLSGPLSILTEGRALARGGDGDVIPVLNLSSRNTVMGRIMPDGTVRVGPSQG